MANFLNGAKAPTQQNLDIDTSLEEGNEHIEQEQAQEETVLPSAPEQHEIHLAPVGVPRCLPGIDDDGSENSNWEDNDDNSVDSLDVNEDEEFEVIENVEGPMQKYLKAVHARLQIETKVNPQQLTDNWLLCLFKDHDWSLPVYLARKVCQKLDGTELTEAAHKQLLQSIGTCATGIEMSDTVRFEHRHRYNHRMGERRWGSHFLVTMIHG